ncbi:hypothetical protein MHB40_01735 [Lysinibacillus sp. FSL K6-0057]|uniref:hypothetical protein n=1 Tax=Lysinibacillus sp. FSL K6-0057 TaxID=2921411 RepID=UPI00315A2623
MKEEFRKEKALSKQLEQYKIEIPTHQLNKRLTLYERFIRYLASPTKDPLEHVTASSSGLLSLKILPLPFVILLAFLQGLLL